MAKRKTKPVDPNKLRRGRPPKVRPLADASWSINVNGFAYRFMRVKTGAIRPHDTRNGKPADRTYAKKALLRHLEETN